MGIHKIKEIVNHKYDVRDVYTIDGYDGLRFLTLEKAKEFLKYLNKIK